MASCGHMRGQEKPTLGNLNGASADPTDDVTQQVFSHSVLGKPAQRRHVSEEEALQSGHRASYRDKRDCLRGSRVI